MKIGWATHKNNTALLFVHYWNSRFKILLPGYVSIVFRHLVEKSDPDLTIDHKNRQWWWKQFIKTIEWEKRIKTDLSELQKFWKNTRYPQ